MKLSAYNRVRLAVMINTYIGFTNISMTSEDGIPIEGEFSQEEIEKDKWSEWYKIVYLHFSNYGITEWQIELTDDQLWDIANQIQKSLHENTEKMVSLIIDIGNETFANTTETTDA